MYTTAVLVGQLEHDVVEVPQAAEVVPIVLLKEIVFLVLPCLLDPASAAYDLLQVFLLLLIDLWVAFLP